MAKASTLIMTMSLLIILLLYTVSLIWRRWLALSYANSKPPLPLESLPEGTLTIKQAILSGDPLLESRLEANLDNLPGQNFLWLIDEDDAEALRIAGKQKRPQIRVVRPAQTRQTQSYGSSRSLLVSFRHLFLR